MFQYNVTLVFPIIIFFIICFLYLKKNKNLSLNLNFLLIIYLLISSFHYFEININSRKYKDISFEKNIISFDGAKIDKFFQNLNWRLNSETSEVYLSKKLDRQFHF